MHEPKTTREIGFPTPAGLVMLPSVVWEHQSIIKLVVELCGLRWEQIPDADWPEFVFRTMDQAKTVDLHRR